MSVEQLLSGSFWLVSESLTACGGGRALTSIMPPDIPSSSAELLTFKRWWNQEQALAQRCVEGNLYHTQDFICLWIWIVLFIIC